MILENECVGKILKVVPEFKKDWDAHVEYWGDDKAGLCNDVAEFSEYIVNNVKSLDHESLKKISDLIEELICDGDEVVVEATKTCILENILNSTSNDGEAGKKIVRYLGEESKKYCRAWDEFTGVETEGL